MPKPDKNTQKGLSQATYEKCLESIEYLLEVFSGPEIVVKHDDQEDQPDE